MPPRATRRYSCTCQRVLRLSEPAAYHRIEAARACRAFPAIAALLQAGELTLTTVCLLRPHLTAGNHHELIEAARGRTKREVEELVAHVRPRPDVVSSVRKVPSARAAEQRSPLDAPTCAGDLAVAPDRGVAGAQLACPATGPAAVGTADVPARPLASVRVLAPGRYHLHVTISAEAHSHLRRLQDLMRHECPSGDPAILVERALALLVQQVERRQLAATQRPRAALSHGDDSRPEGW